MKNVLLLILIMAVQVSGVPSLLAEEPAAAPPPLQLAPGSGIQPPPAQAGPSMAVPAGEEMLRDIHPPMPLPEEQHPLALAAGGGFFLLLLALLFWFFRLRKRKAVFPRAGETALAELQRLRNLMNPEQALVYAQELSNVLRRYIEKRFRIRASRKTTREFFADLIENPARMDQFLEEHGESLRSCLDRCDMAKFARYTPDMRSMETMESAVQDFVTATREKQEGRK